LQAPSKSNVSCLSADDLLQSVLMAQNSFFDQYLRLFSGSHSTTFDHLSKKSEQESEPGNNSEQ
jgi:hypothetical protein